MNLKSSTISILIVVLMTVIGGVLWNAAVISTEIVYADEAVLDQIVSDLSIIETARTQMLLDETHPDVMDVFNKQLDKIYIAARATFSLHMAKKYDILTKLEGNYLYVPFDSCNTFSDVDVIRMKSLLFDTISCADNIITFNEKGS